MGKAILIDKQKQKKAECFYFFHMRILTNVQTDINYRSLYICV